MPSVRTASSRSEVRPKACGLHGVGHEDVGLAEQFQQSPVPQIRGVPVRIERGSAPVVVHAVEDAGQRGHERGLQVVGAHVHVARALEQRRIDQLRAQPRDRAGHRDDRAVTGAGEHDGHSRGRCLVGRDAGGVDAGGIETLADEPTEQVVADQGTDRDAQAELGGAAGQDRTRAAHREPRVVHEMLGLAERRHHVAAVQDQVRVRVAEDQQIEVGHHRGTLRDAPEGYDALDA